MPWDKATIQTSNHALTWSASATDPGWAAYGGPSSIPLDVISVQLVQQLDRVPIVRCTVTVAPPKDGAGNSLLRWLSPLNRTCKVSVGATYNGAHEHIGTFQLRRRRLSWPMAGGVTLDCASIDGHHAERADMFELISAED